MTPETARLRRAFDRSAGHHAKDAVVAREIGSRLLEHLTFLKPSAHRLLDLGAGTGVAGNDLRRLFPQAEILSADLAFALLRANPWKPSPWWRFGPADVRHALCAQAGQLPFSDGAVDLVWANLLLPCCDLAPVLQEVKRVLAPEGLFIFSTLGPDTLKELRAVFSRNPDGHAHVQDFTDMHDIGDALVQAGFSDPVMDREDLTATYADLAALLRDLRLLGGTNTLPDRRRTLSGRRRWQGLEADYENLRRDGGLPATFEIVYGHAWKPAPRKMPDGRPIIGLKAG